ncbi:hypothetical protein COY90_03555 [Candidatus Roizmanbacteria bacterium CG_4_10_14_0_8_um_filter_39_9]|uniref:Aminoacyl-transfer RNA synthetases class-II family profile domain-containing protein n=1 Tax=Candidatus Roizmanbacteria bacterium CG_4_10_14_0_8_um_filter_39_9 TaxID=1974829 RepID=A0A2M7QDE0_9BACT|nr:MAG: hypothetical protein COY90_03555 [Candidatus Roizmanbacteria bacterium CG_4_10_14_0_8_um_filter_39_9]
MSWVCSARIFMWSKRLYMINFKPFFIREEIIKATRAFFYAKKFHEVIVPVLNDAVPLESHLYPFSTSWNTREGVKKYYLSLSPERGIKRMLAMGIGNCFAIAKSFRNLENVGTQHLPEFLMLEWYRENAEYTRVMEDAENLILSIQTSLRKKHLTSIIFKPKWKKISLNALLKKHLKADYEKVMKDKTLGWRERFDQLFVNEIESKLPREPFFLVDFPSRISPLCVPQAGKPHLAKRFELYIDGMEIGNGNTENTNSKSVRRALKKPIDETFLKALDAMDKKTYAGVGLGIDRLAMIFSGATDIKEVELLV